VPWHRDRLGVPAHAVANFSVYLDDSTPDNGCVEFAVGSHVLPDEADVAEVRAAGPVEAAPAAAGDVLVHDARIVHGSAGNHSSRLRRSIIIEFARPGVEVG
jgi:phytanoyl-CoA hydroxylase